MQTFAWTCAAGRAYKPSVAIETGRQAPLRRIVLPVIVTGILVAACQPTVRVEAPKEPITINLNIKLDADVRLRVEEQAKQDVSSQPIF